jgi:hypothetical protein
MIIIFCLAATGAMLWTAFGPHPRSAADKRAYEVAFQTCLQGGRGNCNEFAEDFVALQHQPPRPTDKEIIAAEAAKLDAYCEETQDC